MKTSMNTSLIILLVALAILVIIFAPLLTIWALNTLFNTGIAFEFYSWLAVVFLQSTLAGIIRTNTKHN